MSTVYYHWSDRRSDFALDGAPTVKQRLRPFLTVTLWVLSIAVPCALLGLLAAPMLGLFPGSG